MLEVPNKILNDTLEGIVKQVVFLRRNYMTKTISIGKKNIGGDSPCYIIAEMSANHGGDLNRAIEIIHAAKEAGADCIKIQTYTADKLTLNCDNEFFQIKAGKWMGETLHSLYTKAYTPWEWHGRLKYEAESIGMDFLSTPFDISAVDFLEEMGVSFYKIASFELVDIPLIKYIASRGKPVIMSTGMAGINEVIDAVDTIKSSGNNNICLLKCSSAYPAVWKDMNLRTIESIQKIFGTPVGLSDHSLGSIAAITAVALGAKVIEKHFCVSRNTETPDSSFSMEYCEFKDMVKDIRNTEKALGKVYYGPVDNEKSNLLFRKSIFAVEDIKKNEPLNEKNIRVIRPGNGLEPKYYYSIMGKTAIKDITKGTPISWELLNTGLTYENTSLSGENLLRTERLILREIQEQDTEEIVRWRNQKEVLGNIFSTKGPTIAEHEEWYRQYLIQKSRYELMIITDPGGKKIGTVGLSNLDYISCKAELGILLGEKDEWGKGYGFEACRACIGYGFEVLKLNKINLKVFSRNLNALKLYKRLGFKEEGLLEKECFKNNELMDVIQMALFKEDFEVKND